MNVLTTPTTNATWSYQLQFNFKFKKSPLLVFRTRLLSLDDRRRRRRRSRLGVNCVSQGGKEVVNNGSDDDDKDKDKGSWVDLGNVDSDWFGGDSNDSNKKQGIRGLVGVGLASFLLVAGITFAALSIGKRSSSRPKHTMEPLTEQQELLVTSEDVLTKEESANDAKHIVDEESNTNLEDKSGIENDVSSSLESHLDSDAFVELSDLNNLNTVSTSLESPIPENGDVSNVSAIGNNAEENLDIELDLAANEQAILELSQTESRETTLELSSITAAEVDEILENEYLTAGDTSVAESVVNNATENAISEVATFVAQSSTENQYDAAELQSPQSTFTSRGIPAPSLLSTALQVSPGKVLVPAVTDQTQAQALAALQVLKVIESDAQANDLCTRREYARWLVSASSALSRNLILKVYPAMYIENVTELAFDDITPEDPDFASIQGLAEAGLISSKLSRMDLLSSPVEDVGPFYFHPDSPLSRQDLVTWKMTLEKRQLPEADKKVLHELSGFIDIDRIDPDAFPALVADISAKDQGVVALAFGYTRLFQPDKPVTKGQAAIALATGESAEIVSEELARIEAESVAEKAVSAHIALVAEAEKDVNANFENELLMEKEKINVVQKMTEEATQEVERLRAEREEENSALMKQRVAVESEMEVLSRLRNELEEQLEGLMSNKVKISYEKDSIEKLRKETEEENQSIVRLQYELEVERKALSMARLWAEEEAKRVQEHAKALEEARDRWEKRGIKVVVDDDLRDDSVADTWTNVGKKLTLEETVERADSLTDRLKLFAAEVSGKSKEIINSVISKIQALISAIQEWFSNLGKQTTEFKDVAFSKTGESVQELQKRTANVSLTVKEGAKRVVDDCREGVDKLTQRFKT